MIRILIADDHPLIREGFKKIISGEPNIEVAAEAANASDTLKILGNESIDVIILDISMPGRSGLDLLRDLRKLHPKIPLLILTLHPEERFAIRALKAGAAGYITKDVAAEELLKAIKMVHKGRKYISQKLWENLAEELGKPSHKELHELLSDRELEVLLKIVVGRSLQAIATELSLSISTVNTYRVRILEKMEMDNNIQLVRYALKQGLIE
jgi:two-component system, NarL family, invasion response regulator UvrY